VFFPGSYVTDYCKPALDDMVFKKQAFLALIIISQVCFLLTTCFKAGNFMRENQWQRVVACSLYAAALFVAFSQVAVAVSPWYQPYKFLGCGCSSGGCAASSFSECQGAFSLKDFTLPGECDDSFPIKRNGQACFADGRQPCTCSNLGVLSCSDQCPQQGPTSALILVVIFPLSAFYVGMSAFEWTVPSFKSSLATAEDRSSLQRTRTAFRLLADASVFCIHLASVILLLIELLSDDKFKYKAGLEPYEDCADYVSPVDPSSIIFPRLSLLANCRFSSLRSNPSYLMAWCLVVFLLLLLFNMLVVERQRMLSLAFSIGCFMAVVSVVNFVVILAYFLQITKLTATFTCSQTVPQYRRYQCDDPKVPNFINLGVVKQYPSLPCASQCSVSVPVSTQLLVASLLQSFLYLTASYLQFAFKGRSFQREAELKSISEL
jgi:hypothetical protein